ncbi:MAG TPA: hypothetical protein VK090_02470 [Paracoccaceae bacterium]|nr:hypothetical protein [Paracoccaceae bacterium]
MKMLLTSTAAALLIAGTAYAQDPADGSIDGEMTIDQSTTDLGGVGAAGADKFSQWDTDQDGSLTRDEYEAGVNADADPTQYPSWDEVSANSADPESGISQSEFEDAVGQSDPADASTSGTSDSLGGME